MKRYILPVLVAMLISAAAIGQSGPAGGKKDKKDQKNQKDLIMPGLRSEVFTVEVNGGERVSVIVTPYKLVRKDGEDEEESIALAKAVSNLGLYVYDIHGNCVVWDDDGPLETGMFAAVELTPINKATYVVELRNNGFRECKCTLVVR